MEEKTFYHHGKLLLSGEYLLLDGALGLALPTKKGQYLKVKNAPLEGHLHWRAFDEKGNLWFEAVFELPSLEILCTCDKPKALYLQNLLKTTKELSINFLKVSEEGLLIETYLEFSPMWGLGSSSTLICNLASLAKIDPYNLLFSLGNKASGYDVACALAKKPILYKIKNKIPELKKINFWPSFSNQLFFLYLNQKQSTKESIDLYGQKKASSSQLEEISMISENLSKCKTLEEFEELLELHETILSDVLGIQKIKEKLFPDYKGIIKSLGAWGGDFVLITYREGMKDYFLQKGFRVLLAFEEMILRD